jgi:epoxyqueuosine reductase
MEWLAHGLEKRGAPQKILPGANSFVCVGLSYYRGYPRSLESKDEKKVWISNYAWGEDYHAILLDKLKHLEQFIYSLKPDAHMKAYVDTGPILERSYAQSAGLGWIGKNTLLIHPKAGSYFFVGELITDLDLHPDSQKPDHCGKCRRCLDACPTQALKAYELNANLCLSYLTIEHKGEIPSGLISKMGHQVYGCDICQDVCPWNRQPLLSQEPSFDPRPGNFNPDSQDLASLTREEFAEQFKNSPIKRLKWERLQRNLIGRTGSRVKSSMTEFL